MQTNDARFNRRIRFSAIVIISQMLLIGLSLAWGIYLLSIARNGGVISVENNPFILYGEIFATVLIIQFAIVVIVLELHRLRSRRRREDNAKGDTDQSEKDENPLNMEDSIDFTGTRIGKN